MIIAFEVEEFKRLLHNASIFASSDTTLPPLCAVRLEAHNGLL